MSQRTIELILKARDEMSRSLGHVRGSMDQMAGAAGTLKTALGALGVYFGAREVVQFATRIGKAAADLYDMSAKLGVGTAALSEWQYAAKQAGVEFSSVTTAIRFMNRNISEAATGNKEAAETIRALGLSMADLRRMSPQQQFEAILDSVRNIGDQAGRTQALMDIFGRGGGDVAGLVDQFRELVVEGKNVGATIEQDVAKKFDEADDATNKLKTSFDALGRSLLEKVGPGLTQMADGLRLIIAGKEGWKQAFPGVMEPGGPLVYGPALPAGWSPNAGKTPATYAPARPDAAASKGGASGGSFWDQAGVMSPSETIERERKWAQGIASREREFAEGFAESMREAADETERTAKEAAEVEENLRRAKSEAADQLATGMLAVFDIISGGNAKWVRDLQRVYALIKTIRAMWGAIGILGWFTGGAGVGGSETTDIFYTAGGGVPLPRAAAGYMVPPGPRGLDSVPLLAMPGEGVIRKDAMQRLDRFLSLNESASYISPSGLLGRGGGRGATINLTVGVPMNRSDYLSIGRNVQRALRDLQGATV